MNQSSVSELWNLDTVLTMSISIRRYQDNGYNGNYESNNDSLGYDNGGSYNQGYGAKDNYRQSAGGDYGKYKIHGSGMGVMNLKSESESDCKFRGRDFEKNLRRESGNRGR